MLLLPFMTRPFGSGWRRTCMTGMLPMGQLKPCRGDLQTQAHLRVRHLQSMHLSQALQYQQFMYMCPSICAVEVTFLIVLSPLPFPLLLMPFMYFHVCFQGNYPC